MFWIGPYQRTVSGGATRQNTYGALQDNAKLDNTIRYKYGILATTNNSNCVIGNSERNMQELFFQSHFSL